MGKLVICGDSFNAGIGCRDLFTQPYGILLAQKLGYDPIILARGSASNFAVYLQAKWAAEHIVSEGDVVVISVTSYDRIEWIAEGKSNAHPATLGANNINYHQYPPHHGYYDTRHYPFYFEGREEYDPKLLTEQIPAFDDYLGIHKKKHQGSIQYYKRLHSEPVPKIELMLDYCMNVMDYDIKRQYDIGLIFMAYTMLKRKGIRCIVLSHDEMVKAMVGEDTVSINWGEYTLKYPDTIGSGHASEEAHVEIADILYEHLQP